MAQSNAALDRGADGVAGTVTHLSLHSGDPSTTGANELSAGTAGYARVAKAYSGASGGGDTDIVSPAAFDVSGGDTVSHWGAWDDTTFLFGEELNHEPQAFVVDGVYTLTSAPYSASDGS